MAGRTERPVDLSKEPPLGEAVIKALQRGERVELIPVRDGVKVVRVRREELK